MSGHNWISKLHGGCGCSSGHNWLNVNSHPCGCASGKKAGGCGSCGSNSKSAAGSDRGFGAPGMSLGIGISGVGAAANARVVGAGRSRASGSTRVAPLAQGASGGGASMASSSGGVGQVGQGRLASGASRRLTQGEPCCCVPNHGPPTGGGVPPVVDRPGPTTPSGSNVSVGAMDSSGGAIRSVGGAMAKAAIVSGAHSAASKAQILPQEGAGRGSMLNVLRGQAGGAELAGGPGRSAAGFGGGGACPPRAPAVWDGGAGCACAGTVGVSGSCECATDDRPECCLILHCTPIPASLYIGWHCAVTKRHCDGTETQWEMLRPGSKSLLDHTGARSSVSSHIVKNGPTASDLNRVCQYKVCFPCVEIEGGYEEPLECSCVTDVAIERYYLFPRPDQYMIKGPNSNTFAAWLIGRCVDGLPPTPSVPRLVKLRLPAGPVGPVTGDPTTGTVPLVPSRPVVSKIYPFTPGWPGDYGDYGFPRPNRNRHTEWSKGVIRRCDEGD